MSKQDFIDSITSLLNKYCAADLAFSDTAVIAVNPQSLTAVIADNEDEYPEADCYEVQEFLSMHPEEEFAGNWIIDFDAIEALAEEYFH